MNILIHLANITTGEGRRRLYRPKGGQTMDINIIWDNEELEAIEELNEIFNL